MPNRFENIAEWYLSSNHKNDRRQSLIEEIARVNPNVGYPPHLYEWAVTSDRRFSPHVRRVLTLGPKRQDDINVKVHASLGRGTVNPHQDLSIGRHPVTRRQMKQARVANMPQMSAIERGLRHERSTRIDTKPFKNLANTLPDVPGGRSSKTFAENIAGRLPQLWREQDESCLELRVRSQQLTNLMAQRWDAERKVNALETQVKVENNKIKQLDKLVEEAHTNIYVPLTNALSSKHGQRADYTRKRKRHDDGNSNNNSNNVNYNAMVGV